jgi:hypothetical protein
MDALAKSSPLLSKTGGWQDHNDEQRPTWPLFAV